MHLRVKDHDNLVRDSKNRAIINDDDDSYNQYITKKNHRDNLNNRMDDVESDINSIKSDLNGIKDLLMTIANKL